MLQNVALEAFYILITFSSDDAQIAGGSVSRFVLSIIKCLDNLSFIKYPMLLVLIFFKCIGILWTHNIVEQLQAIFAPLGKQSLNTVYQFFILNFSSSCIRKPKNPSKPNDPSKPKEPGKQSNLGKPK